MTNYESFDQSRSTGPTGPGVPATPPSPGFYPPEGDLPPVPPVTGGTQPASTGPSGVSAGQSTTSGSTGGSTTDAAKQEASAVAQDAAGAAQQVASTAKEQATEVLQEGRQQVRQLVNQATTELSDQAQVQQQKVAGGLQSLSSQLRSMAEGNPEPGVATDLAQQAADKAQQFASWLENRDPGSVLDELRSFARQRPGVFLLSALGAGIVAGRLARGLAADNGSSGTSANSTSTSRTGTPTLNATSVPELPPAASVDYPSTAPLTAPTTPVTPVTPLSTEGGARW